MNNSGTKTTPGFCPNCGSILPQLDRVGSVQCYTCRCSYPPEVFGSMHTEYTIPFNSSKIFKNAKSNEDEEDGPVVERKCPKCDNERMSYATLQLRSADEGQTVFFTCTKCKFKESENS